MLGLKRPASTPSPIGTVATTLPAFGVNHRHHLVVTAGEQAMMCFINASALGSSHGAIDHVLSTVSLVTSIFGDLALVLDVDIYLALAVAGRELWLAAQRDGADNFAAGRVHSRLSLGCAH